MLPIRFVAASLAFLAFVFLSLKATAARGDEEWVVPPPVLIEPPEELRTDAGILPAEPLDTSTQLAGRDSTALQPVTGAPTGESFCAPVQSDDLNCCSSSCGPHDSWRSHHYGRCALPQHFPYTVPNQGYYYSRPYNMNHIRLQQITVSRWGGDPRNPYGNRIFKDVYAALKAGDNLNLEEIPAQ